MMYLTILEYPLQCLLQMLLVSITISDYIIPHLIIDVTIKDTKLFHKVTNCLRSICDLSNEYKRSLASNGIQISHDMNYVSCMRKKNVYCAA